VSPPLTESPSRPPFTVLIIGASGVFGSRLVERAAREPGLRLILAGRTPASLKELAQRVAPDAALRTINRDTLSAADLEGADVVVDAAGPFQASHDRVICAAIAARIPYVDLADGRDFVAAIGAHDAAARAAGVSIITGASSVPALSHAVIDALTAGWRGIETIRIGIFPGNRAPRGLAVVQAILSWAGKPMRNWRDGRWQDLPGWGETQRWTMPDSTRRWASLCDTPDQDLLVSHYAPRRSADFTAGLELGLLHLGLSAASWLVRLRLIASLRPLARPLRWMADWLVPLGSDRGYMDVHVSGEDAAGTPVTARWTLRAEGNRGPFIPTLATLALLRRHRDGQAPMPGARPCISELALDDFAGDFAELGIETQLAIG
jgi:hypothetical protein